MSCPMQMLAAISAAEEERSLLLKHLSEKEAEAASQVDAPVGLAGASRVSCCYIFAKGQTSVPHCVPVEEYWCAYPILTVMGNCATSPQGAAAAKASSELLEARAQLAEAEQKEKV